MEKNNKTKNLKLEYKTNEKEEEEEIIQLTIKLKDEKVKNKIIREENEQLIKDIITVKNNIKSHISCLPQNRLYPFPPFDELIAHIINFINIDSFKLYDHFYNKNQFPIEITILYFNEIFNKCHELILIHFSSVENILNNKFKNLELIKPLKSILKNSYQVNWKVIFNKLNNENNINQIIQHIKLKLQEQTKQNKTNTISYSPFLSNNLKEYIKNSIELFLKCYISQPEINVDLAKIGKIQKFNSTDNECFFNVNIEKGDICYILIPSFYYIDTNNKKFEIINKDKIIKNIDIINSGNEICNYSMYKNISKINLHNSKLNKLNYNKVNNNDKFSYNNNKINFREKKNFENEYYDRKKYSEIYFNSKSYANRNVNYYNFNTNNHSISIYYNVKKMHHNNRNYKRINKEHIEENKNENKKEKRKYIYSDNEDKYY